MIRPAKTTDIDTLSDLGRQFADRYPIPVPYSAGSVAAVLTDLIQHTGGAVFVAESETGAVVGGIVGCLAPLWFSNVLVAQELALWIDPAHRGGSAARRLITAFEDWAKTQGAAAISFSSIRVDEDFPFDRMLARAGYEPVERAHYKGV